MKLSHLLAKSAAIIVKLRQLDGSVSLDAVTAACLIQSLKDCASAAHNLEQVSGISDISDLVAFAKSGEPRPSAEIHDLSEILGRERASRQASEAGPEAKMFVFPTVPRATFDFSQLDNGGDAA